MKKVTVLGSGQLARLMALSSQELPVSFTFVAINGEPTTCVDGLGRIVRWNSETDANEFITELGSQDVITVDRESIVAELLELTAERYNMQPPRQAVVATQNRLLEKQALELLKVKCTPWVHLTSADDIESAVEKLGLPLVIKSLTDGYDGKNQWRVHSLEEISSVASQLVGNGWIAEPMINFSKEVSLISVRGEGGDIRFYPLTENEHGKGILLRSIAPASEIPEEFEKQAQDDLARLLTHWNYHGVLVAEFFVTENGLLVNEMAPRVHNSGHWTQDGAEVSQFENHIRAITGMPLGNTSVEHFAGMLNVLGDVHQDLNDLGDEWAIHLYNKSPRPGRKLGHINTQDQDLKQLTDRMDSIKLKYLQS